MNKVFTESYKMKRADQQNVIKKWPKKREMDRREYQWAWYPWDTQKFLPELIWSPNSTIGENLYICGG